MAGDSLRVGDGRSCESGVITFSIAIYTLVFVTLAVAMIEVQRYHAASTILEEAVEVSSMSALAEYDPYLLDRWGLLALRQDADPDAAFAAAMSVNAGATGASIELDATGRKTTTVGKSGAQAEVVKDFSLADLSVFKAQVVDFAEGSVPLALAVAFEDGGTLDALDDGVNAESANNMLDDTYAVLDEALLFVDQLETVQSASRALEQHNNTMRLYLGDLNTEIQEIANDRQHYFNYIADEKVAKSTLTHAQQAHTKAESDKKSAENRLPKLIETEEARWQNYCRKWEAYYASSSDDSRAVDNAYSSWQLADSAVKSCQWAISWAEWRINSSASAINYLNGNGGSSDDARYWAVRPGFKETPEKISDYPGIIQSYKDRVERIHPEALKALRKVYSDSLVAPESSSTPSAVNLMIAYNKEQFAKALAMGGACGTATGGSLENLRTHIAQLYGNESSYKSRSSSARDLEGFSHAMCSTMVQLTDVCERLPNYHYNKDGNWVGFNLEIEREYYEDSNNGVNKNMWDYVDKMLDYIAVDGAWCKQGGKQVLYPMSLWDSRYYRATSGYIASSDITSYMNAKPKEIYPDTSSAADATADQGECDLRAFANGIIQTLDREVYPSASSSCRARISSATLNKLGVSGTGSAPSAGQVVANKLSSLYAKLKNLDSYFNSSNLRNVFTYLETMLQECDRLLQSGMLAVEVSGSPSSEREMLAGYAVYNTINRNDKDSVGSDAALEDRGTSFTTITGYRGAAYYRERDDAKTYTGGGAGRKGGLSYTTVERDATWSTPQGISQLCASFKERKSGTDNVFHGAELEYILCGSPDETYNQVGTYFTMVGLVAAHNIEYVMGDKFAQAQYAQGMSFGYPVYMVMLMLENGLRDANALVSGYGVNLTKKPTGSRANVAIDTMVTLTGLSDVANLDPDKAYNSYGRSVDRLSYRDLCYLIASRYISTSTLTQRLQNLVKIETSYYYTQYCSQVTADANLPQQNKAKYESRQLKNFDLGKSYTMIKCSASGKVEHTSFDFLDSPQYNPLWDSDWLKTSYTVYRGY